jgi:hypothetical protein
MKKKEEKIMPEAESNFEDLWLLILLPLLFGFNNKPSKVINIYMEDD